MDFLDVVLDTYKQRKAILTEVENIDFVTLKKMGSTLQLFLNEHEELMRQMKAVFAYLDMLDKDWRASVGFTAGEGKNGH